MPSTQRGKINTGIGMTPAAREVFEEVAYLKRETKSDLGERFLNEGCHKQLLKWQMEIEENPNHKHANAGIDKLLKQLEDWM